MKNENETLPPIPVIDPENYTDIRDELDRQMRNGIYDGSVSKIQEQRAAELTTRALNPDGLDEIEKEQAELAEAQSKLEAKRQSKVQAVAQYRNLVEAAHGAKARLARADQQMEYESSNAEAQRDFIQNQLGVRGSHYDMPGGFNGLFAQIGVSEIIAREWPKMREKLVADCEAAYKAALDHAKKHGIKNPPKEQPVDPLVYGPQKYNLGSGKKEVGFRN